MAVKTARATAAAVLAISSMFSGAATADSDDSFGFVCGFGSTNDTTTLIDQDPTHQFGEMHGGPLVVGDFIDDASAGPSHTEVGTGRLHCWIQVNSDAPGHFPIATAHCDFTGTGVISGACQIDYNAGATDNIYLCAMWEISHSGGTDVTVYDDDPAVAGDQCSLAISAGA